MSSPRLPGITLALLGSPVLGGCGDNASPAETEAGSSGVAGSSTSSPSSGPTGEPEGSGPADSSEDGPEQVPPPEPTEFVVTIHNVSDTGLMVSPLSPGLWVNHQPGATPLFTLGEPDGGEGLEALAEDGDPGPLARAVAAHEGVDQVGIIETPAGATEPGPLLPGDAYAFTFTAEPLTRLSLAMMVMGSNDLFIGSGPSGVSLFQSGGQAMPERDVSAALGVWDAGTERNQAPGQGPWQALHGGSPDLGPPEGPGIWPHARSTRALPLGPDLVEVVVLEDPDAAGTFTVSLTNVSSTRRTLVTPLSSLVWAVHDDSVALFSPGEAAPAELEALAEDGEAGPYDVMLGGHAGVADHGVIPGPILPGDTVQWSITPGAAASRLSLATMVMQSNDAFLALGPEGIALLDADQAPRSDAALTEAIAAHLTPWDAGTEANEVPGVGAFQAPRQAGPDTGPPDPDPGVRRYVDVTDDLTGDSVGGLVAVSVARMGPTFTITLTNTSDATAFPGLVYPVVWALHDATVLLFEAGAPAIAELQFLAEVGDPTWLWADLLGRFAVAQTDMVDTPQGAALPGPLLPGDSYEFLVMPTPTHHVLTFAGKIGPSNDTFAGLEPPGVALMDAQGALRSAAEVEADLTAALRAWDAGTEGDQAGAAGADMDPLLPVGSGPSHGSSLVRPAHEDEIWSPPTATGLVRVIVAPSGG